MELTACVLSRHGAADLAVSLLSAPVTVSAGHVEARTLLPAAGFILRGRAGGARKFPRAPASVPIWTLSICTLFVRSEAGMMD